MDPKAVYPCSYFTQEARQTSLSPDTKHSYFPPTWQDNFIDFGLDLHDANLDFSLLQSPGSAMPTSATTVSESTSGDSPSSNEASRQVPNATSSTKKQDRRRAQNRAAQRAYRERKEQVRQELEVQVKMWQERHQFLRESYVDQAQEVQKLKKHIETLQMRLLALQDTARSDSVTVEDFDLWPDVAWKAS